MLEQKSVKFGCLKNDVPAQTVTSTSGSTDDKTHNQIENKLIHMR